MNDGEGSNRPQTDIETTDMTDSSTDGGESSEMQWTATNDDTDLGKYLNYALLAGLSLLALIAALQFYFNASAAINQWVTSEYRSLFQAVFNLVVLLLAGAGITRQVRRLSGGN